MGPAAPFVARSRGEILRWSVRLLSLQSALMAFTNCPSIVLASVEAIGLPSIQGHCPLINFRLTKFLAHRAPLPLHCLRMAPG